MATTDFSTTEVIQIPLKITRSRKLSITKAGTATFDGTISLWSKSLRTSFSTTTFNLSACQKPMLASTQDQLALFRGGVTCPSPDHFHQLYKKSPFELSITPLVNPLCGTRPQCTTPKFVQVTWTVGETLVRVTREDLSFADPQITDHGFSTELFHGVTVARGKLNPVFTLRFLNSWTGSKRKLKKLVTVKKSTNSLKNSSHVPLAVIMNQANAIVQQFLGRLKKVLTCQLCHQPKPPLPLLQPLQQRPLPPQLQLAAASYPLTMVDSPRQASLTSTHPTKNANGPSKVMPTIGFVSNSKLTNLIENRNAGKTETLFTSHAENGERFTVTTGTTLEPVWSNVKVRSLLSSALMLLNRVPVVRSRTISSEMLI